MGWHTTRPAKSMGGVTMPSAGAMEVLVSEEVKQAPVADASVMGLGTSSTDRAVSRNSGAETGDECQSITQQPLQTTSGHRLTPIGLLPE